MRPVYLVTFLLTTCLGAPDAGAQSFQKEYTPANGGFVIPYGAAQRPDGKFLVSHMVNADSIRLYVTCLEPNGGVAWSVGLRAHPNITGNEGFVEGPIAATGDNGCIAMVSKSYQSQVVQQGWALVKLDANGTVQWNRQIAGVGLIDDFLKRSGTRTFVAGRYPPTPYKRYLACLNDDGTALWEKDVSSDLGTVAVTNTEAISGQRVLLMLHTENASLSAGHLVTLDEAGNLSNLLSLPDFDFMDAAEHPDGRLFFMGNTAGKLVLGVFQAGQMQWVKTLDTPADLYFSGSVTFNAPQDSLIVSFQGAEFEEQRLWIQFDLAGNFSKGHYLPSKEVTMNEPIESADGGLAWVSFSPSNALHAFIFTKTGADGRLSACPMGPLCRVGVRDTVLQPLPSPAWTTENVSHIIVRQAAWQYQTITSSDYCAPLPQFDARILASDSTACAGDMLVFRRDSLTTGTSTWLFPGAAPSTHAGHEPPGVLFSDAGDFTVRHVLEQAGCRDTTSIVVRVESKPVLLLPPDTVVCPGDAVTVAAAGEPDWYYHWDDGTADATRHGLGPGVYSVTATNAGGCSDAEVLHIGAVNFPQDVLPADTFSCSNITVTIHLENHAGWEYNWADGFPEPDREFETGGVFTLLAESPEGCHLTDSIRIEMAECPECFVFFPNIIQPGSGGENGVFGVQTGCGVLDFYLQIFDRWGGLIFESEDPFYAWDGTRKGKTVPPGVYIFLAGGLLDRIDGVENFAVRGSITVIR